MTTATKTPLPLDRFQQPAAAHPPGPVLIVGGAGSGRTQAIAGRIAHFIDTGTNPATITCMAASSRTSEHLLKMLDTTLGDPENVRKIFICTYHHMASTILRNTGAAAFLGISPHYTIWDSDQGVEVIQSLINSDPDELTVPNQEIKDILSWDGLNKARWKLNQPIPPQESYWPAVLAEYNKEKKRQNVLDLNDLIPKAVEALETAPSIRAMMRSIRTRHLLADDLQDISPIQYRLLHLLTSQEQSVTVAFDPNQSVYSWRGSDPRLVSKFKMDFPQTRTFVLRNNHRQTQALHHTVRSILEDEEMTGLTPNNQDPARPEMGEAPTAIAFPGDTPEMATHMLDLIEKDVRTGRFNWGDIAILFRRRNLGRSFITQLVSRNIPYTIVGDNEGPDKGSTRRTIALLTLALNPWDTATFSAAATVESDDNQRGLNRRTAASIANISRDDGVNLIKAAENYLPQIGKGTKNHRNLEYIIAAFAEVADLLDDPQTQLPNLCLQAERISRGERASRYTAQPADPESSKLMTMSHNSHQLPNETLRQHLARFLESLKNSTYPELQNDENVDPYAHNAGLIIGSIHSAKGKEWPSVYIMNAVDHLIPGNIERMPNGQQRYEEEQRLFYVALTRASEKLTFIHATDDGQGKAVLRSRLFNSLDDIVLWSIPEKQKSV